MRTKNAAPITPRERRHLEAVKSAACSVCDGPGGYAHHIKQGQHMTTVALCFDCHQGSQNGWHGQKVMWRIKKMDELDALAVTLDRVMP